MKGTTFFLLRTLMLSLCLFMLVVIVYTCETVGSPFQLKFLDGWMPATLIDFYVNVFVLLCWIFYRENLWVIRLFWTFMLIGLGSLGTTLYVFVQLVSIPLGDPKTMQKLLLRKQ